MTTPQAPVGWL